MKVLTEFRKGQLGRPAKYRWDEFLDGRVRRFDKGVDFECAADGFRRSLYSAARARGIKVQTTIDGDSLTFQAVSGFKKARKK